MSGRNVVGGFLHHAASGKVLLHLRSPDKPPCAGQWAFFSGSAEPEDGGDLLTTWCREMREELGVVLDPARVRSLCQGTYPAGNRWHDFLYDWPDLDEDFVLTEGQRYAWFTLDAALALPDLADYAREELTLFREGHQRAKRQRVPPQNGDSIANKRYGVLQELRAGSTSWISRSTVVSCGKPPQSSMK